MGRVAMMMMMMMSTGPPSLPNFCQLTRQPAYPDSTPQTHKNYTQIGHKNGKRKSKAMYM